MALTLTIKPNGAIKIGDHVKVEYVSKHGQNVRLRVSAPDYLRIDMLDEKGNTLRPIWSKDEVQALPFRGFDRVLLSQSGDSVSMMVALDSHAHAPVLGFMRQDGWTIGAPQNLERACFDLWPDAWTHFIKMPSKFWLPIAEYQELKVFPK